VSVTFEAVVVFPDELPAPAMLRVQTSRPALFDGIAVACSSDLLSIYLADPGQPLTQAEHDLVAGARWGVRLVSRSADRSSQLAHMVELAATLFQRGACAVALPAATRLFGAAHLEQALAEPTDAERWAALFVHHHAVMHGERLWLHTHGMQHFGLPDLECVEHVHRAGEAHRILRAVLRRLTSGGPALRLGDVIERVDGGTRFQLVPSSPVEGHLLGAYDVVRLERAAALATG
jgi:hypothetical protein